MWGLYEGSPILVNPYIFRVPQEGSPGDPRLAAQNICLYDLVRHRIAIRCHTLLHFAILCYTLLYFGSTLLYFGYTLPYFCHTLPYFC